MTKKEGLEARLMFLTVTEEKNHKWISSLTDTEKKMDYVSCQSSNYHLNIFTDKAETCIYPLTVISKRQY